jgi:predicted  nucleic acid-binding Zn-ribbon protein
MNPDILAAHEALLHLHVLDQELDALSAERTRTPREIAEEHAAIAALQEARDAAAKTLAAAGVKQREAERSLDAIEKRKGKAEARLPSLGTMGQIEATQREIAALSTEGGELETAILELMDDIEQQEAALAARDEQLAHARAVLAEHESGWAARRPGLEARVTALEAERAPVADGLRPDITRRYQLGRNQATWKLKAGITWADIDRVCRTCKCEVSARWLQEARDHTALHSCDNCKRMLVQPAEEAAEAAAVKAGEAAARADEAAKAGA